MDELRRLESMRLRQPALSLYLPIGGDAAEEGFVKRWLSHLGRPGAGGPEAEADADLVRELERVEAVVRTLSTEAPAIAAFSSEEAGLIKVFELPEEVAPLLVFDRRLETGPLRALLERRPPVLVAVVDKEHGRLYDVWLDRVQELASFRGLPVHRHRQGETLATTLQRRADQQVERNLRPLAQAIDRALERASLPRRLIVAGPPEARATLLDALSRRARAVLEREAAVPAYLSPNEMRQRLLDIVQREPAGSA